MQADARLAREIVQQYSSKSTRDKEVSVADSGVKENKGRPAGLFLGGEHGGG